MQSKSVSPADIWSQWALDLKVPHDIRRRVRAWIDHQIDGQGELGAVAACKAVGERLKRWIIARENGVEVPRVRDYVRSTKSGFPKILDGLQNHDTQLLVKLVNLYKVFKPDNCECKLPRKRAISDRVNAVIKPYSGERAALTEALRLISLGCRSLPRPDIKSDTGHLSIYNPKHPLTPEGVLWLREFFLKNERWLNVASGEDIFAPYSVRQPVPTGWVPTGVYEVFTNGGTLTKFSDPTHTCLGRYELATEPGFKARCYFAPNLVVQELSHPLYVGLERAEIQSGRSVRYLETEAKLSTVQEWLREGSTVWSIDQTAATDRFHVMMQKFYMHCVGIDPAWIRFVHMVSNGWWHVDEAFKGVYRSDSITLAVGQPMGVKYSMPLYTLTLIALLEGACMAWGWKPDFLVLGDDVVIRDRELAHWFQEFAPKIGLAISATKGIVSTSLAEFAGAIIGKDWYTFPGKYPAPTKSNWMSRCESLACPLPGGPTGDFAVDAEAYWNARLSLLTGIGQFACPIYHRAAAVTLIEARSLSDQPDLEYEYFLYQSRRYAKTCYKLARELSRGKIVSRDRWVAEHIGYKLGHPTYISDVFRQLEVAKGMEFSKLVLDEAYSAYSHVDETKARRLYQYLQPKGQSYEERVGHTLSRIADVLEEQAGPKGSLDVHTRVLWTLAMGRVLQSVRENLWDKQTSNHDRKTDKVFGFISHLASSN